MVYTNERLASELDRVAEVCTSTALSEAAKKGAALIRKEDWNPITPDSPPKHLEVIVAYRDDSGDSPTDSTASAWRLGESWISENDILCGEVYAWKPYPDTPEYKEFVK